MRAKCAKIIDRWAGTGLGAGGGILSQYFHFSTFMSIKLIMKNYKKHIRNALPKKDPATIWPV